MSIHEHNEIWFEPSTLVDADWIENRGAIDIQRKLKPNDMVVHFP